MRTGIVRLIGDLSAIAVGLVLAAALLAALPAREARAETWTGAKEEIGWGTHLGGWSFYADDDQYSGGGYAITPYANDYAAFSFQGTNVVWKTDKAPNRGVAAIYLDGSYVGSFDGYAQTEEHDVTGYEVAGLANKQHTLKVVATGQKNPAATYHPVVVDRFVVGGVTYEENAPSITYSGWKGARSAKASGGTYRYGTSKKVPAQLGYLSVGGISMSEFKLITAKGPARGVAVIRLYKAADGNEVLLATKKVDLHAHHVRWQVPVTIKVPNPEVNRMYAIKVHSADGRPVVVDAYRYTATW